MMKKVPKVSVVMAVYNEKPLYLKESIDSILTQTLTDFEFILVDDASKKEIADLLEVSVKQDKRIVLIKNERNLGLTKSLNRGVKIAQGKYIARMDSDDISLPERLETEVKTLEADTEIKLCGSWANIINDKGQEINLKKMPIENAEIKRNILKFNPFIHSSLLIDKQTLFEVGLYDEQMKLAQDYDLVLRIAANYKARNIAKTLIKYRENPNSLSFTKRRESLRYAMIARVRAIQKHHYPNWMAIYLTKPLLSYLIPNRIKEYILKCRSKQRPVS